MTSSRQKKLDNLIGEKYPREFPARETIKSVLWQYEGNKFAKERITPNLDPSKPVYNVAGRILARRNMGKNIFFDLMDQTGTIQLHADMTLTYGVRSGSRLLADLIHECDLGDCVGIEGTMTANPRGEPLLLICNWTLLAKALKEPGDKFHGVKDHEMKYRHRELDLLSSADSRAVFHKRAEIVFEIRKYLNDRDFIEIETPILQPIYGGATAKPFITKHKSLGQDFYLQISSELYLKRAMVGGFDRVYSFSRCFRNEGISPEHNPEFTNLEIFESCATHETVRKLVHELITHISSKFSTQSFTQNVVSDLPSDEWPLSRKWPKNESIAEAWELYAQSENGDMEIASGATDLNDPREQESRLRKVYFSEEDENFNPFDPNYIEALEYGALPWAGVGIGIDRLCMLLLNRSNIREVILFPTLKNQS
jgi:lysyl-tRNA synthetase class II